MVAAIRSFSIVFLFGLSTVTSAQLPPKVLADKYLMQAEQLLVKKDYDAALSLLDKIIAMQKEHGFALRDEFHFKHSKIAYAAGMIQTAIDAVSAYLSAGSKGEFYKEALALLIKAEEEMQEVEITPDNTCTDKPKRAGCWMALSNHPDCYVWNPNPLEHESASWTGGCAGNVGSGEGTLTWLTWAVADADTSRITSTSTGRLRNGRFDGQWVHRSPNGTVWREGSYLRGRMHGRWVNLSGEVTTYMDGIKHGPYILRNAPFGKRMTQGWKGEYKNGKREGVFLYFNSGFPGKQCKSATSRNGVRVTEWKYVNDSMCDF